MGQKLAPRNLAPQKLALKHHRQNLERLLRMSQMVADRLELPVTAAHIAMAFDSFEAERRTAPMTERAESAKPPAPARTI